MLAGSHAGKDSSEAGSSKCASELQADNGDSEDHKRAVSSTITNN
jgi:hypothetical protein